MLWRLQALFCVLSLCTIYMPWWLHRSISADLTACGFPCHPTASHRVFCLVDLGVWSRTDWVWACMFLHVVAFWCTTSGGLCTCWCRWGFDLVTGTYGTVCQWLLQCWECQRVHTWYPQWACHVGVLHSRTVWLLPHPVKISAAEPIWSCSQCSS